MKRIGLAVGSMCNHMTDEGWQIFQGLEYNGYELWGRGLINGDTDVRRILAVSNPDIVVIQDKREWDVSPRDFRDREARFINHTLLKDHPSFKVTILKDAHKRPSYHKAAAEEMGIHLHIIYYDEEEVRKQAPWLDGPVVRTYHTIDEDIIPEYEDRTGLAVLSGAVWSAYPLRQRLIQEIRYLPIGTAYLPHPGYHRQGCATPLYLRNLCQYRVAICTCSIYQYTLRKLIEATACGCRVITNLPQKYTLPYIDDNLIRIADDASTSDVRDLIKDTANSYNPSIQKEFARIAQEKYDYRVVTKKLVEDIDNAATSYFRR